MIATQYIKTNESDKKYMAHLDAILRSKRNELMYSAQQRAAAHGLKYVVETAYAFDACFICYRKKFIAVTFVGLAERDAVQIDAVNELISDSGYTVVATPNAVIVRIMK